MNNLPHSSNIEELFNSISHGIMALIAVAGLVLLVYCGVKSSEQYAVLSSVIYGASLLSLFGASAVYHAVRKAKLKHKFRILDHANIYLLIAGTYTPVVLLVVGGVTGWVIFAIQWIMALVGIVLKLFFTGRFEIASVVMYAIMGWMIVFKIDYLYAELPDTGFWLLVSGGLVYTFGIVFYLFDHKIPFGHFVWHLMVMTGSALHFLLIAVYVI
ncbi:hemolysin III family protein [Cytophagaceae bacterium ABcell3]|nr:hemolysin III family protein [Cytophagaceae bacterium ABcell3]